MFQCFCPHCMRDLLIDDPTADRMVKCPSCGGTFRVQPRKVKNDSQKNEKKSKP